MSRGLASALQIAAGIIRDNADNPAVAEQQLRDRINIVPEQEGRNGYVDAYLTGLRISRNALIKTIIEG